MHFVEIERDRYADDGEPPVEWDHYLEVGAALSAVEPNSREQALMERGVDACTWARAEQYWMLTFALDLQQGQTERADAFGRACAAAAGERAAHQAELQNEARPAEVLISNDSVTVVKPAEHATEAESDAGAPAPGATAEQRPTFLRVEPVLSPPVAPPVHYAPVVAATASSFAVGTSDALPIRPQPAVPFGATPSAGYVARLRTPAAPPARPAPDRPDATLVPAAKRVEPTLPFAGRAASKPPPKVPELTVVQFAMLSAELAFDLQGARRGEILARYRVESADVLSHLGAEWQRRINSDARIASQWRDAYARHRASLQEQARKR